MVVGMKKATVFVVAGLASRNVPFSLEVVRTGRTIASGLHTLSVDQNYFLAARRFAALLAVPPAARYATPQPTVRYLVEHRQEYFD
jgi:hypothetical protein